MLHPKILISIQTEFVDNEDGKEMTKQDCERKACWRLMEKLKKAFPRLPICLCGDSLYACEGFIERCRRKNWRYILRYKEGSIPSIAEEYRKLKRLEKNYQEGIRERGKNWYDYVTDIDYKGYKLNLAEYGESREHIRKRGNTNKAERILVPGGFASHKKNYQALKNHYYLLQIGHMISQCMEMWEKIWKKVKQSMEQKHRRLLESMKETPLEEHKEEMERKIQIRFI